MSMGLPHVLLVTAELDGRSGVGFIVGTIRQGLSSTELEMSPLWSQIPPVGPCSDEPHLISPQQFSLRYILILSYHIRLGLMKSPEFFQPKFYGSVYLFTLSHVTDSSPISSFLTILGEDRETPNYVLFSFP